MEFNLFFLAIFIYVILLTRFNDKITDFEEELNDLLIKNFLYFKSWKIATRNFNKIKIKNINQEISSDLSFKHYNINDIEIIISEDLTKLSLKILKNDFLDLMYNPQNEQKISFVFHKNKEIYNNLNKIKEIILMVKIINYNLLIDKQNIKNFENLLEYKNSINKVSKNKYLLKD